MHSILKEILSCYILTAKIHMVKIKLLNQKNASVFHCMFQKMHWYINFLKHYIKIKELGIACIAISIYT